VLEDWSEPFPGYFLYDPSRRQRPPRWQPSSTLFACRHSDSGRPWAGARLARILEILESLVLLTHS
jgi:hypothetical protein